MFNNSLQGCSVVVTRSAHQAQGLAEQVQRASGTPVLFPALKISKLDDNFELDQLIQQLKDYSMLILISPNAVNYGLNYVLKHSQLPSSCQIATVGRGSAESAKELLQREVDIVPTPPNSGNHDDQSVTYSSESLLEMPEMHSVAGKRIAILRGNGGRELLANTLRQRGAHVDYIATYQRSIPNDEHSDERLQYLLSQWHNTKKICVTIYSGESLQNFVTLLENHAEQWLARVQLIVINERIYNLAIKLGFKTTPLIATNTSDQAIYDCVTKWYKNS